MTVRMVEEVQCDHCGRSEEIVLASHDDQYHVCARGAAELLRRLTHAPVSWTLEGSQTVTCVFCGKTWVAGETGSFVAQVNEGKAIKICDSCIIEAAREAIRQGFISVRIQYDC